MNWTSKTVVAIAGLSVFGAVGCSDVTEPPETGASAASDVVAESDQEAFADFLARQGIELGDAHALFTIGWHERRRRDTETAEVVGHAMAVGFGDATTAESRHPAIDMGSVALRINSDEIELRKRERRNGDIVYSTGGRPRDVDPVPVPFVAGADYEFEASGSAGFPAGRFTIAAPSALVEITSHSHGETIDPSKDLVIEWKGSAATKTVVHVMAMKARGQNRKGPGDGLHARKGHRGRRGPGHDGPPAGILEVFDDNPGTFSVPAERLQELIGETGAARIMIRVGQITLLDAEHDGGTVKVIARNGDGVGIEIQ